jgi:hypothetical protein
VLQRSVELAYERYFYLVLVGCAILDANRDTFCHWALGAACATACEVIALSGTRRLP